MRDDLCLKSSLNLTNGSHFIATLWLIHSSFQMATPPTVQEVNCQADCQPDDEANDSDQRQAHNQYETGDYRENWNYRYERHPVSTS